MTSAIWLIMIYVMFFICGTVTGSFINVCAVRIPQREDIVKKRSHCDHCGYVLKWYDLVPIVSYLFLRGRCRKCKTKISSQHLIIEVLSGCLYCLIFYVCGISVESLLYCLAGSALMGLSLIDWKTYEIPVGFNIFIGVLGIARIATDFGNWYSYVIGGVSVSLFLCILYYASKGHAIGGGDVKLMTACGLLLGWKLIILAFLLGCIVGSIIHIIRMKVSGQGRVLAMGPYLSAGVMIAALWGDRFIAWYLNFLR